MTATVGYAALQIIPSLKGASTTIRTQLSGPASTEGEGAGKKIGDGVKKGLSSKLGGIAKVVAGAFVVEKAYDFFKDAIKDADAYKKTVAGTAAVLKATGGAAGVSAAGVGELAEKISRTDGVSKDAAQGLENMVLRFKNIKNVGADKVFDDTTQAAEDLAAATGRSATSAALQLGKALNDPTKGLSALGRAGVTFTAAQTKQIQAMQKSGNLLGAQKLILDRVKGSFGGAAAAAVTPLQRLKISTEELQTSVGQALIPKLNTLALLGSKAFSWAQQNTGTVKALAIAVGVLGGSLLAYKVAVKGVQVAQNLASAATALWSAAQSAAAVATKVVTGGMELLRGLALGTRIQLGLLYVQTIAVSIAQKVAAVATKVWAAGQWLLNAALDANPIGLIVIGLAALAIGLVIAYKKSATFRAIVVGAFNAVRSAVVAVFDWVKSHWPLILVILTGPIGAAVVFITRHWATVKGIFTGITGVIRTALSDTESAITEPFKKAFQIIVAAFKPVESIISTVSHLLGGGGGPSANAIAAGLKTPHGRARGGPVRAGVPYIVGEHQAELFVPNQSGRIMPDVPTGGPSVQVVQRGTYYSYDPTAIARAEISQARKALAVAGIR